jgi:hypothetical protein
MSYTDWKDWATRRPEWMQEDLGSAFEEFVERKWQDALNIATAEPLSWGMEREKTNPGKGTIDKTAHTNKGVPKVSGAVNVVSQQSPPPRHTRRHGTSRVEGNVGHGIWWGAMEIMCSFSVSSC